MVDTVKNLPQIIAKIMEKNEDDIRIIIAEFFTYLEENEMIINGTHWESCYNVHYKGKLVCNLCMNEECVNFLIEIVGDYSTEYKNIPIDENIKKIAWENVRCCSDWGCSDVNRCGFGKRKTIFDKEFDNVCRYVIRFDEMNLKIFECIKQLLKMRKTDILTDITLNQYLDF